MLKKDQFNNLVVIVIQVFCLFFPVRDFSIGKQLLIMSGKLIKKTITCILLLHVYFVFASTCNKELCIITHLLTEAVPCQLFYS